MSRKEVHVLKSAKVDAIIKNAAWQKVDADLELGEVVIDTNEAILTYIAYWRLQLNETNRAYCARELEKAKLSLSEILGKIDPREEGTSLSFKTIRALSEQTLVLLNSFLMVCQSGEFKKNGWQNNSDMFNYFYTRSRKIVNTLIASLVSQSPLIIRAEAEEKVGKKTLGRFDKKLAILMAEVKNAA